MLDILLTFETQEQLDSFIANLPEGASIVPNELAEDYVEPVEDANAVPEVSLADEAGEVQA